MSLVAAKIADISTLSVMKEPMQTVVIVIHLIVVVFMIGLILVQRSEGGALGIGGGGNNFMSARGQANVLTRSTTILAAVFFLTSLALSLIARYGDNPGTILDQIGNNTPALEQGTDGTADFGAGGLLESLPGQLPSDGENADGANSDGTGPQSPDTTGDNLGPQVPVSQ